MPFDLVLRGGRVIDPSQKLDAVTDVAFAGGKVVKVGNELKADPTTDVRDVSGYIVTPGPDRSAHPCLLGRHLARHRRRGVLPHLRRHHGDRHRQRRPGQFRRLSQARDRAEPGAHPGLSARLACRHLRLLESRHGRRERGAPADESRSTPSRWRTPTATSSSASRCGSGATPRAPRGSCRSKSRSRSPSEVGMPLMAHIDHPPPSYEEVLARLRPGDVLTHCLPAVSQYARRPRRAR